MSDDCCATDATDALPCPRCGQAGPVVGEAPVRTHRPDAEPGAWQYCATAGCPVVFHLDTTTVTEDGLRNKVGNKATAAAEPVCFCFGHTRSDLADDLARNDGTGTIKPAIKAAVADGLCACEHLNPDGPCCLAAVRRTIKAIQSETVATP